MVILLLLAQDAEEFVAKRQDFTIDENSVLGCGRFGRVLKGTFQGKRVAVKVISTAGLVRMNLEEAMREVKVMATL